MNEELAVSQGRYGEDYGRAIFQQEFYCSFDAAIPGSIWGDCVLAAETQGRVCALPLDPASPVYTAWDLGRTDDTSIWFYQFNGRWLDVLDHHSSSMKDLPYYLELLEAKRREHGITYARHWLPHDARPRTLAAGGKSILQQLHDGAKANPLLGSFAIGRRLDVQEGIQAGRATFPHCRFHATRCAKGLDSLRQYHREWDDEKKMFVDQPAHDWASHDADAFRYLSLAWTVPKTSTPDPPLMDRLLASNPSGMAFGTLKDRLFTRKRREREMRA